MSDGTTPGAPSDLATTIGITTALTHLVERMTGAGRPVAPPRHHEPKQVRQSGPVRDKRGRFTPRR